jgi:hypothetical protein
MKIFGVIASCLVVASVVQPTEACDRGRSGGRHLVWLE